MAISWVATGITASSDTTNPYGNLSYTLPTGHTSGDLLIAFYGGKPYNTVPSTPTDYTAQSGGANGTTAMGTGSGSVYAVAFTKVHDGTESNPTSTFSAQYSPGIRAMLLCREDERADDTWTVTSCKGSDTASTGTSFSATGDATLGYTAGDQVVVLLVHNDDSSSDSAFAISITGCTVGTVTQQLTGTLTTGTGNDGRMYVLTAPITSGTASAAPVVTATTGSGDSDGQAVFLRIEPPPLDINATATLTGTASLTASPPETVLAVENDAEDQTSGTAVTTSNAGGGSNTNFDDVSVVNFDSAIANTGTNSFQLDPEGYLRWSAPSGCTQLAARVYFSSDEAPPIDLVTIYNSGGTTATVRLVTSSGTKLRLLDSAGSTISTGTVTVDAVSVNRLEVEVIKGSSTGYIKASIYDDTDTLVDSLTATNQNLSANNITFIEFSNIDPFGTGLHYLDDLKVVFGDSTPIGGLGGATHDATASLSATGSVTSGASILTIKTNDAEDQPDGTIVTTSNSSAPNSNPSALRWEPTYSSTWANSGSNSFKFAAGNNEGIFWETSSATESMVGRFYFYQPVANSSFDDDIVYVRDSGGSNIVASVKYRADGKVEVRDDTNTSVLESTPTLTAGTVYRFEFQITRGTTTSNGYFALQVYEAPNQHSNSSPLISLSSSSLNLGTTDIQTVLVGGLWENRYVDDLEFRWGTTTAVGPIPAVAVSAAASLTAAGSLTKDAGASLTGTGSLTSAAVVVRSSTGSLSATGSLTTAGTVTDIGAASFTATASLTSAGVVTDSTTAALSATGSLTTAGTVEDSTTAALSATGSLTAVADTTTTHTAYVGDPTTVRIEAESYSSADTGVTSQATGDTGGGSELVLPASATGSWALFNHTLTGDETAIRVRVSSDAAFAGESLSIVDDLSTWTMFYRASVPASSSGWATNTATDLIAAGIAETDSFYIWGPDGTSFDTYVNWVEFDDALGPLLWTSSLTAAGEIAKDTTASLTGTGALTAAGEVTRVGVSSLSATGSLTSAGSVTGIGAASLNATASLTSAGVVLDETTAALSATGSLAAAGEVTDDATASLSATGALSATGLVTDDGTASLSATGALTADSLVIDSATASLSSTAALSVAAIVTDEASASLSATGTLTVDATTDPGAVADLAATGSLTSDAVVTDEATSSLSATGSLTSAAQVDYNATVSLTSTGALTAAGVVTDDGAAALSATGILTTSGVVVDSGTAALSATGSLTSAAEVVDLASASFTCTGSLTAAALVTDEATSTLGATGTLTTAGEVVTSGSVSMSATGLLSVAGSIDGAQESAATFTGALTAAGQLERVVASATVVTGALTSSAEVVRSGQASLGATGSLTTDAVVTDDAAAALSATAILTASASGNQDAASSLSAAGSLTTAAQVEQSSTVTLGATGAITSVAAVTRTGQSALSATGLLTAAGVFETSTDLAVSAQGALFGLAFLDLAGSGTVQAQASLTASAGVVQTSSFRWGVIPI